jgi:hypothetical protein
VDGLHVKKLTLLTYESVGYLGFEQYQANDGKAGESGHSSSDSGHVHPFWGTCTIDHAR